MEIITPGVEEKGLAGNVVELTKKHDDARNELRRQWLVNVMFLYGKHHFTMHRRAGNGEEILSQRIAWEIESMRNNKAMRRTSNYILPLFRSVYSRLISMKANINASPTTSMDRDRDAARVANEVGNDFWENCNKNNPWMQMEFPGMQGVLMKLVMFQMTMGNGYLFPKFNRKAKTMLYDQQSKNIFEAAVGEAEADVDSVMNVFKDRYNRHVIHRRYICPEQVEYEFDQKVDPEKIDENSTESKIMRLLEGEGNEKDDSGQGLYVYSKYCIPTSEYPQGRVIHCTKNKVLADEALPTWCRGKIPVIESRYQDLGFMSGGQGMIEQLVDLQQDYNYTITRIAHLKKTGAGKILAPRGAKLSAKWDDEINQIIYYASGRKPEYMAPATVPAYLYEEIKRIREDMENLANSHDSSMGRNPSQVKSGVGIQNLADIDNSMIAPEMIMFEHKLSRFMEIELDIMQENYNERRLLDISGDDLAFEVKSFIGSDLFGQKKIMIRMGSGLPTNKTDRQNYIIMLRDKGFIGTDRAKDLLEFGDLDGIYTGLDETKAKQDILNIIDGNWQVIAEPWEDHTIFLKVINDFRKGTKYEKLPPELRAAIDDLASQHQEMLLGEQKAASNLGGGLPPAAQPPQPAGAQ